MKKTWNEPEIVSLDVQETMASTKPQEELDGAYGAIFGGYGYDDTNCGKS